MSVVFGLLKMSFWVPKKKTVSYHFRKADKSTQDPRFSGNGQKRADKFENIQFPLNNRTDKIFLAQPKINLQSLKCP